MSSAYALVRFQDGTVVYGKYSGTSDTMGPFLTNNIDEIWDKEKESAASEFYHHKDADVLEEVAVWSDYGGGFGWAGRASKNPLFYGGPWDLFSDDENYTETFQRPIPDWVTKAVNRITEIED